MKSSHIRKDDINFHTVYQILELGVIGLRPVNHCKSPLVFIPFLTFTLSHLFGYHL